jgi:uncharacterized protein (TIGR02246 family)
VRAPNETEEQVVAALEEWAAAYAGKDADAFAGRFSDDDDVLLFGTGSDEVAVGRQEIADLLRRDFEQADQLRFTLGEVRVSAAGDVAWAGTHDATVDARVGGQEESYSALRLTAVLQRRDGRWLIQHAHLSAPLAGQEVGQSFPARHRPG